MRTGEHVPTSAARSYEKRLAQGRGLPASPKSAERLSAMLHAFIDTLQRGVPSPAGTISRLDKIDTAEGLESLQAVADSGVVPYPVLLYERFLGRPFASYRDAVSEKIGDALEDAIEELLITNGIPYYRCQRTEKLPGVDQAPDFSIPSRERLAVAVEAKIAEDDGTARDKVTRIQHLAELGLTQGFDVIACIAGRGFAVRTEDLRKLIASTKGQVFTLVTLPRMLNADCLRRWVGQARASEGR